MFPHRYRLALGLLAVVLVVAGVLALTRGGARWEIPLAVDGAPAGALTAAAWRAAADDFPDLLRDEEWLPLEGSWGRRGGRSIGLAGGAEHTWDAATGRLGGPRRRLEIGEEAIAPARPGHPPTARIAAATTASSRTWPHHRPDPRRALPAQTTAAPGGSRRSGAVILDGLPGYMPPRHEGDPLPGLPGRPRLGRSVYPSDEVSTATMLAGATPTHRRPHCSTRDIAAQTILQTVTEAGKRAVVGNAR